MESVTRRFEAPPSSRAYRRRLTLLTAVTILIVGWAVFAIVTSGGRRATGWSPGTIAGVPHVAGVDPRGLAAGQLERRDRIVAIDGVHHLTPYSISLLTLGTPDGTYSMTVEREGRTLDLRLTTHTAAGWRIWTGVTTRLTLCLAFLVTGLFVGWQRPSLPSARLFAAASLTTSLFFLWIAVRAAAIPLDRTGTALFLLTGLLHPLEFAAGYLFYATFPPEVPRSRAWTAMGWALVLVGTTIAAIRAFRTGLMLLPREAAVDLLFRFAPLFDGQNLVFLAYVIVAPAALCAVVARNWLVVGEKDQRRRLRWLAAGSVAGLLPWLVSNTAHTLFDLSGALATVLEETAILATLLIPISVGYAVVRHRIFDIDVVARQGVRYLLAKNTLRAAVVIPIAILAARALLRPDLGVGELLFGRPLEIGLMAAAVIALRTRSAMSAAIDRRFFRERYDQEKILLELVETVRNATSRGEIARLLSEQIELALHPRLVLVFLRRSRGSAFDRAHASAEHDNDTCLAEHSPLIRLGDRCERALNRDRPDARVSPEDLALMEQLGASLILPLRSSDQHLLGLIILGAKRSEEPYSTGDERLLRAVASQAAIAAEVLLLKDKVSAAESLRHDVLARLEGSDIRLLHECPSCGRCFDTTGTCPEDGDELTLTLPVERLIDGRYLLERRLGAGGMGAVFEGRDQRLERAVAVKILGGRFFGHRDARARFNREARASAKLSHPNVVAVHDFGSTGPDGAYLVMELVRGGDLRRELAARRRLDPRTTAHWMEQVLDGVAAAHAAGVVHRDLKPANILIDRSSDEPRLKVADFGLARLATDDGTTLTQPGSVLGSLAYMSPEQLAGEVVDERSDIFSLAVIIVELLSGHRPFSGTTPGEVLAAMIGGQPELPPAVDRRPTLRDLLACSLAVDRDRRPTTVAELRQRLAAALETSSESLDPTHRRAGS